MGRRYRDIRYTYMYTYRYMYVYSGQVDRKIHVSQYNLGFKVIIICYTINF